MSYIVQKSEVDGITEGFTVIKEDKIKLNVPYYDDWAVFFDAEELGEKEAERLAKIICKGLNKVKK